MINEILVWFLESNNLISGNQAGFRKKTIVLMLLILILNRVGDMILPCETPCSCTKVSDNVEPICTLKEVSDSPYFSTYKRYRNHQHTKKSPYNVLILRIPTSKISK